MAIEPIVFREDERTVIETVLGGGGGWDSPDLDPIRARIKQGWMQGDVTDRNFRIGRDHRPCRNIHLARGWAPAQTSLSACTVTRV